MMKRSEQEAVRSLREMEEQVWAEGQEWMRQRFQQKLQQQADQRGRVFPPQRSAAHSRQGATDAPPQQRRGPGVARVARHKP